MNRKYLRTLTMIMSITLVSGILAGCGTNKSSDNSSNEISGTITATGSTALQPLADAIGKKFTEKYPDVTVNIQGGGSGTGLKDVAAGNVEIGNSDVFAEEKLPKEQAASLEDHKVAVVGFAAVVNEKVKIDSLTKQQLIDIFTGKVTNWKDVGGDDLKITILSRPASSGTRATFKKYALDGKDEASGKSLQEDSSGTVAKTLKETEGSISYLASSYLKNTENIKGLKVLKFEGVDMNKENITSGKYPIWSYEHMYTKKVLKNESAEITKLFLEFMISKDMADTVNKLGYFPISDMKVSR